MTREEIEKRFDALQRELDSLKWELLKQAGVTVVPGFGPIGQFAYDPGHAEADRVGREYRERVNRESLAELDREADRGTKKPRRKKNAPT
jgi:hypothetical protein